jgi:hypothetical protein
MKQEVTYAKLHSPLFFPGPNGKGINFKETLDSTGLDKDIKMFLVDNMLLLNTRGVQAAIPLSNVVAMVIKPE